MVAFTAVGLEWGAFDCSLFCELHQPIESGPAHQLGICVIATAGARLPNAFIGQSPAFCDLVTKADQRLLHGAVEVAAIFYIVRDRIYDLAVNVELELFAGGVTPDAIK